MHWTCRTLRRVPSEEHAPCARGELHWRTATTGTAAEPLIVPRCAGALLGLLALGNQRADNLRIGQRRGVPEIGNVAGRNFSQDAA